MKLYSWNLLEDEPLNPHMTRKAIHGGSLTVARLHLLASAVVPEHSHANEQLSMVERGALKFLIGGREQIVRGGEALLIAPHEPHAVEALEETFVTDVFSPAREDWIRGDDAYLRR
jgi:quercetin dioxygenase-like cupin family protein